MTIYCSSFVPLLIGAGIFLLIVGALLFACAIAGVPIFLLGLIIFGFAVHYRG